MLQGQTTVYRPEEVSTSLPNDAAPPLHERATVSNNYSSKCLRELRGTPEQRDRFIRIMDEERSLPVTLDSFFVRTRPLPLTPELYLEPRPHSRINSQTSRSKHNPPTEVQAFSTQTSFSGVPTPFPTSRRPVRRPMSDAPAETIEEWFANSGVFIGPLLPQGEMRQKVKRLLYTYQDINATDLASLKTTDLYTHRVRLKPGTKPWFAKRKKRMDNNQIFWLGKIVQEGLACGLYERTSTTNEGPAAPRTPPPQLECQRELTNQHEISLCIDHFLILLNLVIHHSDNLQTLERTQIPIPCPVLHIRALFGCESTQIEGSLKHDGRQLLNSRYGNI